MVRHIMTNHDETFSKMILEYVNKVKESCCNVSLSYMSLLTRVFENFKAPFEDAKCIKLVNFVVIEKKLESCKSRCTFSEQQLLER